jgi:hypothetical protein
MKFASSMARQRSRVVLARQQLLRPLQRLHDEGPTNHFNLRPGSRYGGLLSSRSSGRRVSSAQRYVSGASWVGRSGRLYGDHFEARECAWAERGHDRDVGGIAPACHQDAADARLIVAGIERVPAAAEIDFEPGAEIHRRIVGRHADVARYPVQ